MIDRPNAMLVDTNAIRVLGWDCSARADDLSTAAAALKFIPAPSTAAVFGPVGAGFLAALAEAAAEEARGIAALGADLASAQPVSAAVAETYADADQRGGSLL